jgi:hypothetical protein
MGLKKKTKTALLTMKVSPEEKAEWQEMAKRYGVTLSELIRSRLTETPKPPEPRTVRHRPPPKVDPDLIRQIVRIGNNLNQIALRCNTGQRFEVLAELAAIERQLEEIKSAYQVDDRRAG